VFFEFLRHNSAVEIPWLLLLASLTVGILVGLTGVGGGALMTPILIAGFAVPAPVAIATDLLFATVTKVIGVLVHGRAGRVDWAVARSLWWGSIPAVLVGSVLLVGVVSSGQVDWVLWLIVGFVALTALTLVRGGLGVTVRLGSRVTSVPRWLGPLGGVGIGLGVSLTSVGAGVLGMALLVRISPKDIPPQRLVATDLLHAIPIALVAGVSYSFAGLVDWELLMLLLIGSLPGVVIGSLLSGKVPARALQLGLGVILLGLALLLAVV